MRLWPLALLCLCFGAQAFAGLGDIADGILKPLVLTNNFLGTVSICLGVATLFGSVIRYSKFRINPLEAPIGSVVFLVIIGLALLVLPFVYRLNHQGVPYGMSDDDASRRLNGDINGRTGGGSGDHYYRAPTINMMP